MSERDDRYAPWYEPMLGFLLVLVMLVVAAKVLRSEIRDLQRRVGQLEQSEK